MNAIANARPNATPGKFIRIAALIGAIWYAFGLVQFWSAYSMDPSAAIASGAITPAHGSAIAATPFMIWMAFALASAAGLLGSLLLLTGSGKATMTFAVSLISALVYYAWVYGLSGTGADRPQEEIFIAVTVVAVTAIFLGLSRKFS